MRFARLARKFEGLQFGHQFFLKLDESFRSSCSKCAECFCFFADSIERHSKEIDERKNMEQDVAAWVPSSVVPKKGQHLFGSLSCFSSLPSF